jgi:mannose-6-phosphate isomerase
MQNEPFLLKPVGKDYLWGGRRLNDEFEKKIDMMPLAETWECSTHSDGVSYAGSGRHQGMELTEILMEFPEYMGSRHAGTCELPVLVKFIDAKENLSIQVHPTDDYAKMHENGQLGKTEMWYVLDAGKDAKLIYGLKRDTDADTLRKAVAEGVLHQYLRQIPVQKGDVFFVEAGTLHAIGAGVLLAEIQENSNLTYRLYDYDRVDKNGEKRELHIDKALEAANLKSSAEPRQPMRVLKYQQGMAGELLCRCKYFEVYRMLVNTERKQKVYYQSDNLSFRVLMCINGCGTLEYRGVDGDENISLKFYKGDCMFVPAASVKIRIHGQAQFLDIRG